jgi:hypothetical protein
LDRQYAEVLAHLVANALITGVMNTGIEVGEASPLAQILLSGRLLREHLAHQLRDRMGFHLCRLRPR